MVNFAVGNIFKRAAIFKKTKNQETFCVKQYRSQFHFLFINTLSFRSTNKNKRMNSSFSSKFKLYFNNKHIRLTSKSLQNNSEVAKLLNFNNKHVTITFLQSHMIQVFLTSHNTLFFKPLTNTLS